MSSEAKGSAVADHGAPLRPASHPLAADGGGGSAASLTRASRRPLPHPDGTAASCQADGIGGSKMDKIKLGAAGRAIVS